MHGYVCIHVHSVGNVHVCAYSISKKSVRTSQYYRVVLRVDTVGGS